MGSHYLRKYGAATTLDFELYKLDGTGLKSDAASATHDIKIMKDEGAEADTTADAFVDEGQGYSLALTATEMTAARVVIYIVDQTSPQAWLDKVLIIETYGNASAQHIFDLGTATVNLSSTSETQIDNIETDTNELQGLISASKIAAQVKGIDDIDLSATMKASVNTEVDNALNTAVPAVNTANSVNDLLLDQIDVTADAVKAKTDLIGASVALETGGNIATILTETQSHPTLTEIEASSVLAKEATFTHATYGLDKIKTETAAIKTKTDNLPVDPADDSDIDTQLAALSVLATAIKKVTVNKWAIVGSQLIYYDDNGTTPLYTYTLDSVTSPTSRTPV